MNIKLKSININAFRGITELNLPLNNHNLVLLGDNGKGKSSFVEALEFFFTGQISRFKKTGDFTFKKHAVNINYEIKDMSVEIEFNNGTKVSRKYKVPQKIPKQFTEFFKATSDGSFILRRAKLLEFI